MGGGGGLCRRGQRMAGVHIQHLLCGGTSECTHVFEFSGGKGLHSSTQQLGDTSCTALRPPCPSAAKGTENDGLARQCCLDKAGEE